MTTSSSQQADEAVCPYRRAGVTRRSVLLGAVAAAATAVVGRPGSAFGATASGSVTPVTATTTTGTASGCWSHAVGDPRGTDVAVKVGRTVQGRFGLMFPSLKAYSPPDDLLSALAGQMVDPRPPMDDVSLSTVGDDRSIPSGYVYLGQFLDHDITRDTTPLDKATADPHALLNFDTPRLDLASVYGRGPALDPQLYDPARPGYLLLTLSSVGLQDLPRDANGTAFVGDPRNDENLIITQLQIAVIRLHNTFMAAGNSFAEAQRLTRWHYQWVIVNDYLPHVVGPELVNKLLVRKGEKLASAGTFYRPKNVKAPMMPLEFSVAAYRFGHSLIRAEYEMHEGSTVPLFNGTNGLDLGGSRPLPPAVQADWNYFFELPGIDAPDDRNFARLVDTQVSLPLANLPATVVSPGIGAVTSLPERNLLRGKRLGLPSGQAVASAMGIAPLSNTALGLSDPRWGGQAPLWFYVLKESELLGGQRLGPVGGQIVTEVVLGLLTVDQSSYFNAETPWAPAGLSFGMGDLLLMAGFV